MSISKQCFGSLKTQLNSVVCVFLWTGETEVIAMVLTHIEHTQGMNNNSVLVYTCVFAYL